MGGGRQGPWAPFRALREGLGFWFQGIGPWTFEKRAIGFRASQAISHVPRPVFA